MSAPENPRRPVIGPLIQTISIALLSLVPAVAGVAALIWALGGLLHLPTRVWIGADVVVGAALILLALPIFVRIFRDEQVSILEERAARGDRPST